jgi:hypothetical protein
MHRLPFLLALAALGGCAQGSTYTIAVADMRNANERAARYCHQQDAIARLDRIEHQADGAIEIYRCIASS